MPVAADECPPRRENLLLSSERFDDRAWQQQMYLNWAPARVLADSAVAPNGTQTADLVVLRGPTSSRLQLVPDLSPGTTLTLSMWIKGTEVAEFGQGVFLNAASGFSGRLISPYLKYLKLDDLLKTREWHRVEMRLELPAGANELVVGIGSITGESTCADVLAWGAQVNPGARATEYLSSTSATVVVEQELMPPESRQGAPPDVRSP
jgi:hypothetical protein